ncbi:hypothetical protein ACVXG9_23785 [Escherichia coli]
MTYLARGENFAFAAARQHVSPEDFLSTPLRYEQLLAARKEGQTSSTIAVRHWMKNRKWAPWGPWHWI